MSKEKIVIRNKESFCLDEVLKMVEDRRDRNLKRKEEKKYGKKGKDE